MNPPGLDTAAASSEAVNALLAECLVLDCEFSKNDGRLCQFAAILGNTTRPPILRTQRDMHEGLRALEAYASGAKYLVGHNLIDFDVPLLAKLAPQSALLRLAPIDTLRLSPLAFPRNPYHRLVKHYQDGAILRSSLNDPTLDARYCMTLLEEIAGAFAALARENAPLFTALHWLCGTAPGGAGFAAVFHAAGDAPLPSPDAGRQAILACLREAACSTNSERRLGDLDAGSQWPLAYALAWISVAGGNSVMPPWVRHTFPLARDFVQELRDTPCGTPGCSWCHARHHPVEALRRYFSFPSFRPEPVCADGRPMQEAIVEAAMRREHVLGILPTGTGKSLCYQIPALARYEHTGALTVVISPLVALMADQVRTLADAGIDSCAALNSLLSMPERMDVLERVRLGNIAILLISPEQLRNPGFQRVAAQREIGAWVLDEAHCLSKWGHDFRTDYRYIGRFIQEFAGDAKTPPVLCLTATAKPDVVSDIEAYFVQELGRPLLVFNGGAKRANLSYHVVQTETSQKIAGVHQLLEEHLGGGQRGGAIVYCATRSQTEELAAALAAMGWNAEHFHAGLSPERKKDTQQRFIAGECQVITATNAFGMGIDKPDVRLVVHADIPGSIENYVQEAGRAGRDREPAACVLLYCEQDVDKQFGLSALSRLQCYEIQAVLRALRRLARHEKRPDVDCEVVATPGEILSEDDEGVIPRDAHTDDTRVRTAIAWLEEAKLVSREANRYQVYPSSISLPGIEECFARLQHLPMPYRGQLRAMVQMLFNAGPQSGVSTDELMGAAGLSHAATAAALRDLERLGILRDDMIFTALVHAHTRNSSRDRYQAAATLERDLIAALREQAPDMHKHEEHVLHLRTMAQHLRNLGHANAYPETLMRLLRGLSRDGRTGGGNAPGSIRLRKLGNESLRIVLQRAWDALDTTASRRRDAAGRVLEHLLERLPPNARGVDLLAETTLGRLHDAIELDLTLAHEVKDVSRLVAHAALWLHDMEILRLGKGMVVFRPAMTIRVRPKGGPFTNEHFQPLREHYNEQIIQIHLMAAYARYGIEKIQDALRYAEDYFRLNGAAFLEAWRPLKNIDPRRQTTSESWERIVGALDTNQRRIVKDNREQTNVLVLAGPGSGKTRVLVHRIAYLVRCLRERPDGIIALAYNRHAAAEIRRRLQELIGDDARRVTVLTCHALAMRMTGRSFAEESVKEKDFASVLVEAAALLSGSGESIDEADGRRDRLLAGFRWILVDEYQDMDQRQYALISALAGRTLNDPERRLSLFAVGDDDQNIYGFKGASVEFIRRFQEDYKAKLEYLVANYRSTANIIAAANAVIAPAGGRMKTRHEIVIDPGRANEPPGGAWEALDDTLRGRVRVLRVHGDAAVQAAAAMGALERLAKADPSWDWSKAAIISRHWKALDPVQAYCELHAIPVHRADADPPSFWRLRETQALLDWLGERPDQSLRPHDLGAWLDRRPHDGWWELLRKALDEYRLECGDVPLPAAHLRDWLAEWGREARRSQRGLLLTSAHRAKGLEFDHVVILDWGRGGRDCNDDPGAERRLYYVAMTRARKTLTLLNLNHANPFLAPLDGHPAAYGENLPKHPAVPGLNRIYRYLGPEDVDLSFAGRNAPDAPVHGAIRALTPGSPLVLTHDPERPRLVDQDGRFVGRLAKGCKVPANMDCVSASVHAVLRRYATDGNEDFRDSLQSASWEVLLPLLVFAPRHPPRPR